MKVLTIGRTENCHIQIDNPLISRQHAILKVSPFGRMTLTDRSTNGTFINGNPLKTGMEYRVSRRDVVTFAKVAQLDWKVVPNPLKKYIIGFVVVLVLALAAILLWGIPQIIDNGDEGEKKDTTGVKTVQPPIENLQIPGTSLETKDPSPEIDVNKGIDEMKHKEEIRAREQAERARIQEEKRRSELKKQREAEEAAKKEAEEKAKKEQEKQEKESKKDSLNLFN